MSGDSESQIRDRLGGVLDTITPATPPLGAVMRQGRSIRARRRIGVAAGLAVVIGGFGAVLPGVIGHAKPSPPARPPDRVTVSPPGKDAPAGLIATGTVNGKSWRASLGHTDYGDVIETHYRDSVSPFEIGPANVTDVSTGPDRLLVASVGKNVARLTMRLPGGAVLHLRPVPWDGHRWVAAEVPAHLQILNLVAYSRSGELAHAIPFTHDRFATWLRPGQQGEARHTFTVGSGIADGKRWSAHAYTGPWGNCFEDTVVEGSYCETGAYVSHGQIAAVAECGTTWLDGNFYLASVSSAVRVLRFKMSDGSTRFAPAVGFLGVRFAAVKTGNGQRIVSWSAYGASDQRLGSGKRWSC
jgi:hypothetical protein